MVSPRAGLSAVAIVGPTAVGKSDVADRLAAHLSSEVLSGDAMQIYRGMDIGTAKMAPDECTVPLRLVDIVEPGVAYSAALYQADARAHVERIKMRSRRYAKRQLSWFKRDDRIVWFDMDEFTIDEVVEDILHCIEAA